ncbi:MAG: hypothetical protein MUC68_03460 [Burkholderiaceae bacterium]|jgi:hypothetical protein|nr:hypothetical protein [Burkholderiaceae bacterium]
MDATPQRHLITSRAELADGLLGLLGRAQRAVRCCAHDGSVFDLGSAAVVELLRQLVLSHRGARVLVLVDDPLWIETRAPRFKHLQRRFGHAVQIRAANVQDAVAGDMQLMIDDLHCLALKPSALTAGEIWFNNQHRARPMLADFDRRWIAASHDLPVVPLGL